ncbi:MAG: FoF1 ATP synthase subunit gamma [Burkholderiales bacterium]|jgi:F-type H+-transporting ATPase subunit gamma
MSRRQNLERHRRSLTEIREIMNSMKTLAYMETRKLAPYLDAQQAVVQTIEAVAADFLSFYPGDSEAVKPTTRLLILIGSERGLCGDFNRTLLNAIDESVEQASSDPPLIIAVGAKLHTLLEHDLRVVSRINGAGTSEEVASVLNQLVEQIISLQREHGRLEVSCLYHGSGDGLSSRTLLPPFRDLGDVPAKFTEPPVLNVAPAAFLLELSDQYLFAALHALLYASMMMENHDRVRHLDGAVRHIDDQSEDLARQCNALRQEEIIEEIEVILLSAASVTEELAAERD